MSLERNAYNCAKLQHSQRCFQYTDSKITKKLNLYASPSYKLTLDILRQGTHMNNLFKATQDMLTSTFMPSLQLTVPSPSGNGIF